MATVRSSSLPSTPPAAPPPLAPLSPLASECSGVALDSTCFTMVGPSSTFDECQALCGAANGAMACPSSDRAIGRIVSTFRTITSDTPGIPALTEADWTAWGRNRCPTSSPLAAVRWRVADFVQTLGRAQVMLEERDAAASVRASCVCESPPRPTCAWVSEMTNNLCPRDPHELAAHRAFTEAARPCDCGGLLVPLPSDDANATGGGSGGTTVGLPSSFTRSLNGGEWLGLVSAVALLGFIVWTSVRVWRKHRRRAILAHGVVYRDGDNTEALAGSAPPGTAGATQTLAGRLTRGRVAPTGGRSGYEREMLPPLTLDEFRADLRREWEASRAAFGPAAGATDDFDPVAQAASGLGGLLSDRIYASPADASGAGSSGAAATRRKRTPRTSTRARPVPDADPMRGGTSGGASASASGSTSSGASGSGSDGGHANASPRGGPRGAPASPASEPVDIHCIDLTNLTNLSEAQSMPSDCAGAGPSYTERSDRTTERSAAGREFSERGPRREVDHHVEEETSA